MDKFETQFEDLDVATGYYENATSSATAVGTPQDDVDKLIAMTADEAGVELSHEMKVRHSTTSYPCIPVYHSTPLFHILGVWCVREKRT